ncbi:MAG: sigma-54-dependent Fis family transcriptional regulator [Nannocystaceae bacterium]|nr:sigma-54-dependent Fis family transcriptional regulator [Nannocystaceae bacterium]
MSSVQTAPAKILVADDETSARAGLVELLRDEGFEVRGAADAFKALGAVDNWTPDLLLTDVHMPGMDGIELLAKIRERFPDIGAIIVTAFSTVERAVQAMRLGADDYLTKPVRFDELLVVVDRVLRHRATLAENQRLRQAIAADGDDIGWVGGSKASRELTQLLRQVADSPASVLLTGESGTGKELAARALHKWSSRAKGPFVSVHTAALNEGVLESELFGHTKGAFTGATGAREGRFSKADGGTLFLDEIAEIPMSTQVKLLRFLQEREFQRVGSDETESVDVRVVTATHQDLMKAVTAGTFREDLYYRLNVICLRMPTLRERRDDIPLLAMSFLKRHAARNRKELRGFSDRTLEAMQAFDWPGNVRQLENCVERAVVMCNEYEIEPRHLPREVLGKQRDADAMPVVPGASLAELERYAILQTLESVGGSTSRAAKILGTSPRTIQYRMNEYRAQAPSGKPAVVSGED